MNSARRMFISVAAVVSLLCAAKAVPIAGGISLAGGYTVNTGNLNTATAFSTFSGNFVTSVSGSFAAAGVTPGTAVTVTPFTFTPPSTPVAPLWATSAGPAASFNLTTLTKVEQLGDDTLDLAGRGMLNLAGYESTAGDWVFTANQGGGTFSWSASNATVPEGGATAVLLGIGVLAIGIAARRKLVI